MVNLRDLPPLAPMAEGAEYSLHAAGDAYLLRCKPERRSALLEGEDAARFELDYELVLAQFPTGAVDRVLAQLWDQGGYGWLASDDGDE